MANISIQGYNVGPDASIVIMDQFGDVFSEDMLGLLTEFELRSVDIKLKITPISNGGIPVLQNLPNGLRGTMKFARTGPAFQALYTTIASGYYNSGTISQFYASIHVLNRNGSVDELQIDGMQFSEWEFGNFRGNKEVDLSVAIEASMIYGSGGIVNVLNSFPA